MRLPERGKFRRVLLPSPVAGTEEQGIAAAILQGVIHPLRQSAPGRALHLRRLQKSLLHQQIQVDKIGISRKNGAALVGAVAHAGGTDGQKLPIALPRLRQKVHKVKGRPAQRPDAIGGRQGGDVQ